MWQSAEILNVFNTITWKQIFRKMKTFFKKLKYCFLVESIKIENTSFLYKTTEWEANVKANKMMSTNGPIIKNGVLTGTAWFFWIFCFSLRTSYNELIRCTNDPNGYIRTFCKRWSFIWWCFFPVSILNNITWNKIYAKKVLLRAVLFYWFIVTLLVILRTQENNKINSLIWTASFKEVYLSCNNFSVTRVGSEAGTGGVLWKKFFLKVH